MRIFISIALAFLAVSANAFDSSAWDEKRRMHLVEAERLQGEYAKAVERTTEPAENVTVPFDTFEDGSVKTLVFAKRAQYFLDSGIVYAEGVTLKKLKKDGSLDARLDAESCVIDRYTKSGWAEGQTILVQGKTTFKGEGVYFSSPDGYVKVSKKSDIVSEDLSFGGLRP